MSSLVRTLAGTARLASTCEQRLSTHGGQVRQGVSAALDTLFAATSKAAVAAELPKLRRDRHSAVTANLMLYLLLGSAFVFAAALIAVYNLSASLPLASETNARRLAGLKTLARRGASSSADRLTVTLPCRNDLRPHARVFATPR